VGGQHGAASRLGLPRTGFDLSHEKTGSSEEIVGGFGLGKLAKRVIEGQFQGSVGAKTVGFSHGDFGLVIQALDDATGDQLSGPEVVED